MPIKLNGLAKRGIVSKFIPLQVKFCRLREEPRMMIPGVKWSNKAGGFAVKSRSVPIIQASTSHGGLRYFCVGYTTLAKSDFLLDFKLMIFEPLQGIDFRTRYIGKQFFGFVEAASLMRGFRSIPQRGKMGRS